MATKKKNTTVKKSTTVTKSPVKKASPRNQNVKEPAPIKVVVEGTLVIRLENISLPGSNVLSLRADNAALGGGTPFEFVVKIKKLNNLIIERIDIQNGTIFNDDLATDAVDAAIDTGKTSSIVPGATFLLTIIATGDVFTSTTFNLTCDDKNVFDQDQEIKITGSGRGGYRNLAVPLP